MLLPAEQSGAPGIEEIVAFLRVAETGSFTLAGERLGLPKSTVSRRVARLEAKLGVQLVHRTTRSLALTEAGTLFHERASRALAALEEASSAAREGRETPRGHLRVTAPYDVGAASLAPLVTAFTRQHPEVTVEVLLTDRTLDLVAEGIDLALRGAAALPDSSLVGRKLASLEFWLAASPAYLQRRGTPRAPAELAGHELGLLRASHGRAKLTVRAADGSSVELAVRAAVSANGFGFLLALARAGGHVVMLPDSYARPELRAGRLVRVLPEVTVGTGNIFLVHPATRVLPAKVRAFRDFVLEHIELLKPDAEGERSAACPTGRGRRGRAR